MNNIVKCPTCERDYIDEEYKEHTSCMKPIKRFGGCGTASWHESWEEISYDGGLTWYRSTDYLHQKNQPQNGQSLKTITL